MTDFSSISHGNVRPFLYHCIQASAKLQHRWPEAGGINRSRTPLASKGLLVSAPLRAALTTRHWRIAPPRGSRQISAQARLLGSLLAGIGREFETVLSGHLFILRRLVRIGSSFAIVCVMYTQRKERLISWSF